MSEEKTIATEQALEKIKDIEILGRNFNEEFVEILVDRRKIPEVLSALRKNRELKLNNLHCMSGVDYIDYLEVVYHLYSYDTNHKVVVKTRVKRDNPVVTSAYSLWKTADFQEREIFELYGVEFSGHPNLKRLLLNDDFKGFPYRKDFPLINDEEWLLEDNRCTKDYGIPNDLTEFHKEKEDGRNGDRPSE